MMAVDNHSHIILADIEDMIASAKAKSIERYSVTEHVSQFREPRKSIDFGSVHKTGRIFENLGEYQQEFTKVVNPTPFSLRIRCGMEVDFSPRYERKVADYVNQEKWDFLLCSVHELLDGSDIEKYGGKKLEGTLAHELWTEYFKLEQLALESDFVPYDVLTHPVRLSRSTVDVPDDFDDLVLDLAKKARRKGKALELNGKDLELAPDLVRRLAIACSRADCTVSLGSDAHHPAEVFRNMSRAMALVEELGLRTI